MEELLMDKNHSIQEFCDALGSSLPAPGGGGAAALCGALGSCLMSMVGSLTVGKKKYAEYEQDIILLMQKCKSLSATLLELIEEDAKGFLPLAKAYSIPKEDIGRTTVLEDATLTALKAPLKMLDTLKEASDMLPEFYQKGSRLAISDVGCAACLIRSAAEAAILNVFINTKALRNITTAESINGSSVLLLNEIRDKTDSVYSAVCADLKGETVG